ncbi:MAG TPA: arginase family protein [Aliidongia sp.]|uniref:arginase family protein n=1 Tax=Aliidongia sp. TaxID=1914230 RepID=UPI002DDD8D4B|nr:arginase family protein [Aliidongia sp.]HEV2678539.1 arginase family protein [Aliidongia sp.]
MTKIELIRAPSNLGLRPLRPGHIPGAWRAPQALKDAGLERLLNPAEIVELPRPTYSFEPEPDTRIGNGREIRRFSTVLAEAVSAALVRRRFPLVVGGDCSVLLGCLLGARRHGACGLVHVDGHSDFFNPGNYDPASRLGSVAGMDLALATGRGEALLTDWGTGVTPLVADRDVVQIGEREACDGNYAFPDIHDTVIRRMEIGRFHRLGPEAAAAEALGALDGPSRLWLHVDLDVLDQLVMPAVDSPGTPGMTYTELEHLVKTLRASGRIVGADVTIYDPDLDPDGRHARAIARCIGEAFS